MSIFARIANAFLVDENPITDHQAVAVVAKKAISAARVVIPATDDVTISMQARREKTDRIDRRLLGKQNRRILCEAGGINELPCRYMMSSTQSHARLSLFEFIPPELSTRRVRMFNGQTAKAAERAPLPCGGADPLGRGVREGGGLGGWVGEFSTRIRNSYV